MVLIATRRTGHSLFRARVQRRVSHFSIASPELFLRVGRTLSRSANLGPLGSTFRTVTTAPGLPVGAPVATSWYLWIDAVARTGKLQDARLVRLDSPTSGRGRTRGPSPPSVTLRLRYRWSYVSERPIFRPRLRVVSADRAHYAPSD